MRTEPVALSGLITAAVTAILGALVALGVFDLTAEQSGALLGAVGAVVALGAAAFARGKVTPVATLGGDVDEAPLAESDQDTSHLGNGVAE